MTAATARDPASDERRRAFREAVTEALRLDPFCVVIGAIRDAQSAELAARAAAGPAALRGEG